MDVQLSEINSMFNGKKILIVGGSSGIGLAVAEQMHRNGAHVVIASRKAKERMDLMPQIETYSFDITLPEDHNRLLEAVGVIDHLVITVRPEITPLPFQATGIEMAKQAFETKFWGQFRLIQTARSYIRDNGSITLTSGIAGDRIYREVSVMAIINSATETLCRALALELAPVRVNCVSPGFIEPKPEPVQELARRFPAGRLASRDEVASSYVWLMANAYMTGTILVVDGGARLI